MATLPETPQGPPSPPAQTTATTPTPRRELLSQMIDAEGEEVNWAFASASLDAMVTAHFEIEMRTQREYCRAVITAVAPYLITNNKEMQA